MNMINDEDKLIMDYLYEHRHASVNELKEVSFLSASTIRRRLSKLQSQGLVARTHGGAKLNGAEIINPVFEYRMELNAPGKKRMATAAVKMIKDGDVVFLDSSTSAFYIAEYLDEFENLTVITNGVDTLALLSKLRVNVFSTGGKLLKSQSSVLVGNYAESMAGSINADIVFFSAMALSHDGVISDNYEEGNSLLKVMIKNSKKKVFLCDGEKFNKTSTFKLCTLKDVDCVISDADLAETLGDEVKNMTTFVF